MFVVVLIGLPFNTAISNFPFINDFDQFYSDMLWSFIIFCSYDSLNYLIVGLLVSLKLENFDL